MDGKSNEVKPASRAAETVRAWILVATDLVRLLLLLGRLG